MSAPRETEWQRRKRRERMRAEHDGRCDICGADRTTVGLCGATWKRALDEDHDHATGAHRGFICARSNRVLWPWVTAEWLICTALYLDREAADTLVRRMFWERIDAS